MHISAGFWLLPVVGIMAAPLPLTVAVLLAAALHESGHLLVLRLFRVPVEGLRLGAFGAVIHARGARRLSYGRELLVTWAGSAANLLLAPPLAALSVRLAWEWGVLLAGANVLLGLYNLLPIPPLDGGRALYLMVAYCFGPAAGEAAEAVVGLLCAAALTALGAYLSAVHGGALFLLAALGPLFGLARQFGLAKNAARV